MTESQFIFNSLLFLLGGILVMWMAAGFCMLEAGLVRTRNVATMCLKNLGIFAIAGIVYFLVGYNLMYGGTPGGWIGGFGWWQANDVAALSASPDFATGHATSSDWFFQVVFVATATSIVSGTVAERSRLFPFFIFSAILSAFIYPIQGSWTWGGGWLSELGFKDFAGSTIVHSVGGWAALSGALILGARRDKYGPGGRVYALPGSSLPLATLGTFILWFGWFGFNGASQLALGTAADVVTVANVVANTNVAACGGVIAAIVLSKGIYGKVDLTMALNGALAGLVSITAGPDTPTLGEAALIGAVGGVIVVFAVPLLDRLRVDDVVGAIPVHLLSGIWGTLAVPLTNGEAEILTQVIGIVAVGLFVGLVTTGLWFALKFTIGIRLSAEDEARGADAAELGLEAYPEFGRGSRQGTGIGI